MCKNRKLNVPAKIYFFLLKNHCVKICVFWRYVGKEEEKEENHNHLQSRWKNIMAKGGNG